MSSFLPNILVTKAVKDLGLTPPTAGAELEKKIELFNDLKLHLEIEGRSLEIGTRVRARAAISQAIATEAIALTPIITGM